MTDWADPAYAGRPVPAPSPGGVEAEYFAAVERGELRFQECPACGARQFYPRQLCARCGAEPVWSVASGRGRVYTFSIVRQNLSPPFSSLTPYVVAIIELDEGPRMMGNITGCPVDEVRIGMDVEAYAVRVREGVGVPFWRPVAARP